MDPQVEDILRRYTSRSGQMFEDFGFPRISGEIGALLYLHKGPMSLEEIADFLSVSKGSVSTNCRHLQRMKFIRSLKKPGDRKDYYEFSGDLWPALKEALESFNRGAVSDFKQMNEDSMPQLEKQCMTSLEQSRQPEHMIRQLKALNQLYRFFDLVISLTTFFRDKPAKILGAFKKLMTREA